MLGEYVSQNVTIAVLHEDADLIVLDKPAGLAVHAPATAEKGGAAPTVVDWLLKKYPEVRGVGEDLVRPGIVHRLDRETSGVLVVARTQVAFDSLKKQFAERQVKKKYVALVHGLPKWRQQESKLAIRRGQKGHFVARHPNDVAKMPPAQRAEYRESTTNFIVMQKFPQRALTLLEARPKTGRTHQIRVHLKALGFPIVGDALYGAKKDLQSVRAAGLPRQFLHATELRFTHPRTRKTVSFSAELPGDLLKFLKKIS